MDANKKADLENPLCPDESRILADILKNHHLKFSIAASSSVPWIYLRFTKLIVGYYITAYPEISRRARDRYHNLANDVMIKSIFNSGKSKGIIGMKIPDWMIIDQKKLIENYRLYAKVFGVDVPTTQSQPNQSTQGTHRRTSAPRSPNPVVAEGESSAPRRSIVIRLHTLQVSLADQKSHEELEATQNVEKVKEHLLTEEIKKLVEGSKAVEENVEVNSSPLRNDDNQTDPDTKLEPRSDKETLEVEITVVVPPVNVNDEEEESAEDDYELRRREMGKYVEEIRNIPSSTTIRSPRILTNLVSSDTEKLQELMETDQLPSSSTPSSSSPKSKLSLQIDSYHYSKPSLDSLPRRKFNEVAKNPEDIMMESLPKLVDDRIKVLLKKQVPLYVAEELILEREKSQANVAKKIAKAL
ncbi:hypothetical protein Tco_0578145 [Tanacetum coccineum]